MQLFKAMQARTGIEAEELSLLHGFGFHFSLTVMGVSWNFAWNLEPATVPGREGVLMAVGIQMGVMLFGQYLGWGTSKELEDHQHVPEE